MHIQKQIKTNKLLEESCALLHYIPKIILKEYYSYTDKFISVEDPSAEMFAKKIVYNEFETFQENLKYIYKISNFIKCCGEVYFLLIIQVENEMAISSQNFLILHKILKRVIINKFKKVVKQNKAYIKRIMTESQIPKVVPNQIKIKKKPRIRLILNDQLKKNKGTDISNRYIVESEKDAEDKKNKEKMKNITKKFGENKKNILLDKMSRISKALELNIYNIEEIKKERITEKNNKIKPMACINSNLMSKMLNYIDKDMREKIISLRTCERHLNYKNED